MLFKSQVIAAASGSVGGLTASRNKGGMYFRARAKPTDPGSTFQTAIRNFISNVSTAWVETLTTAQRADWETYAANVPLVNKLGDSSNVSGINMYIRSNVARLQVGLTRVDAAPTIFDLGTFTTPSVAADASADEITVTFTTTDGWAGEVGGAMIVLASRPQNASKGFFKGPYRFADDIRGAVVPPTSPFLMPSPFPLALGQRQYYQVRICRADARLSPVVRLNAIVAA